MNQPRGAVSYNGHIVGKVERVEGNLCWYNNRETGETDLFIWRFKDGLNTMFSWEGKVINEAVN